MIVKRIDDSDELLPIAAVKKLIETVGHPNVTGGKTDNPGLGLCPDVQWWANAFFSTLNLWAGPRRSGDPEKHNCNWDVILPIVHRASCRLERISKIHLDLSRSSNFMENFHDLSRCHQRNCDCTEGFNE